jgi:plasmid replication initiation protein
MCVAAARAEAKIMALEQRESQALGHRQEVEKVKQELADLTRMNDALEADKTAAEKASADAVASAAAEQKRALVSQEQVTAIARELEEVASRTAQQVEAAQEEGRQLKQQADAAIAAKEMVRSKVIVVHYSNPWHALLPRSERRLPCTWCRHLHTLPRLIAIVRCCAEV